MVPVLWAALVYVVVSAAVLIISWRTSDHHFIYALDDTYIGMAMAKNLALHGVWGVSPYGFSSSDSSLLFPLLMAAGFRVVGVRVGVPLVLSWVAGLLSIFAAGRIVARYLERKWQAGALILFVLFTPLFVAGTIGMEHSLHLLLTLMFLGFFLRGDDADARPVNLWAMGAVAALMVAARYEGLFFVAPAFCVLAFQRRWKAACAVAVGAAVPVCAYAAFSMAHGAYWLPNSVALKGVSGDHPGLAQAWANLAGRVKDNFQDGPQVFLLMAAAAAALIGLGRRNRRASIPLALLLAAGCLQVSLAQVGMYYRYDAYLFGAGTLVLACTLPAVKKAAGKTMFAASYFLTLGTVVALTVVSIAQFHMLPRIARNIYLRQWQMGRFVGEYYPGATVAANDIGAVNYLSHSHCYDLVGLANQEIFWARRSGGYTTDFLRDDAAAHHVQIAIAYDRWFGDPPGVPVGGPPLPSNWIRVAHWQIDDPTIIGDTVVSFYAVDPAEAALLRADLEQFEKTVPGPVRLELP
ncbi:MAG TPA: glycosyltransferase family 39 protein [Acidobacteriaceae bacterium]